MAIRTFYRSLPVALALIAALAAALVLLLAGMPPAAAQGRPPIPTLSPTPIPSPTLTPTPNPTATAAAVFFTIEQAEMISRYPAGVEYVFRARSSAGQIERVQVLTWVGDGAATSSPLSWDAERGAFVYFDRLFSPPWMPLNFRFRAVDSAGNMIQTADMTAEYIDPTRKWIRRENDEIVVLMFGTRESLADDLFASATQAMQRLEDAFGFTLDFRPYVVVMPDQASFQEWQEYPEPYLAGLTLNDRGYTIQTLQWGEDDLVYTTVPHELTHIFQGFIREARDIPAWFIEGHASYFETRRDYDYEQRVRDVATHPAFPSLQADISLEFPGPDGRERWVYDLGFSFINYWIKTYGWESHRIFWQAQRTMRFQEALAAATGVSFEELEAGWRAYIGAPGAAPTLIPTPPLPPLPTSPGLSGAGG